MTLETLIAKFDVVSAVPDAVPHLRDLILQLAVQGKLVPQNSADEPASRIVERAKAKMTPSRWNQALKMMEEWQDDESAYSHLPPGWAWACNALLGDPSPRNDVPDDTEVAFAPMNQIPTDYRARPDFDKRRWGEIKKGYTHFADGDVAVAKITPCFQNGKACVMLKLPGGIGAGTTELLVLRPFPCTVDPLFMLLFFKSPGFVRGGVATFSGTAGQQRVSNDYFKYRPVPLPPLAEQKRIVAKVDELMALCDRLEEQQRERETRHAALARGSLARFTEAPTSANLQFLFQPSYSIAPADLRKSILTLAVQGKLVPSNPDDEQADQHESHRQVEQNGYVIPDRWSLASLSEVAEEIIDCPHSTPKWTKSGKVCVRTNQFKPGFLDLSQTNYVSEETYRERIQRLKPEKDDILYSREGGILGVACRVPQNVELCLGQRMMLIRGSTTLLIPPFLEMVLNSPLITGIARKQTTGGAAPRVNVATVKSYPIPIPPLGEQCQIVAKVEQLMALVNELETQLAASRTAGEKLLEAVVAELTQQA